MRVNDKLEAIFRLLFHSPTLPVVPVIERSDMVGARAEFGDSKIMEACVYNGAFYTDRGAFKKEYYKENRDVINKKFGGGPKGGEAESKIESYLDGVSDRAFRPVIVAHIYERPGSVPEEILFEDK